MDSNTPTPMKLPHVFLAYKAIDEGSYKLPNGDSFAFGGNCELYDDKSDADGHDLENWESRMMALDVSSSVVGLYCPELGYKSLRCSGIVFDCNGVEKIISSANVLGESCDKFHEKIAGHVSFVDKQYNVVIIHADFRGTEIRAATLDMKIMKLGDEVTAVGRDHTSKLMASRGRINIRGDHLTCDDLCSSSCSISEVTKGSPADKAGICVGDVIVSCNDTYLSSPFELTDILFNVNSSRVGGRRAEKRANAVQESTATTESQTIVIESLNPPAFDQWPLFPPTKFQENMPTNGDKQFIRSKWPWRWYYIYRGSVSRTEHGIGYPNSNFGSDIRFGLL
ncbi:hypothetical protein KSS87_012326 [Heliosperma pusillum]|nr:hypothetical protein KSS87_012326 [Heliosperma pusillum]